MALAKHFASQNKSNSLEQYQNSIRRFTLPSSMSLKHFNENSINIKMLVNKSLKENKFKNDKYLTIRNSLPASLTSLISQNQIYFNNLNESIIQENNLNKINWAAYSNNKTIALDINEIKETNNIITNKMAILSNENLSNKNNENYLNNQTIKNNHFFYTNNCKKNFKNYKNQFQNFNSLVNENTYQKQNSYQQIPNNIFYKNELTNSQKIYDNI